jgi:hypothetical protein
MGSAQEPNHVYDLKIGPIFDYTSMELQEQILNGKIVLGGLLNKEMQTVL